MASSLNIVEIARVTPSSDSAESLALHLTIFDILWLKFPPVQRVFFYRLTESTCEFFDAVVLPSLKSSLSLALSHFLPLAGRLVWDPQEPKPTLVYSPDDAVSLTVAESGADFSRLSGDGPRGATELYPLVPELPVSDNSASVVSLQVTLFPNQGFCIAISAHHAVLDGKTTTMFLKAWAHLCKRQALQQEQEEANNSSSSLPPDLTPFYDRTVINCRQGLDTEILNIWLSLTGKITGEEDLKRCKNLKLMQFPEIGPDVVRVTFELTRKDIQTLRDRVRNASSSSSPEGKSKELRLSNFVIALAYVFTNMVRARGGDPERQVAVGFAADCRSRLNPPIPENYFGNGVAGAGNLQLKAKQIQEKQGFIFAVETVSDLVVGMDSWTPEEIPELLENFVGKIRPGTQAGTVAGSTRFGVYGSDFGWGRPEKVEVVSIDKGEAISMAERRDGGGGVEIGLSLRKHEMEILIPMLRDGLN